MVHMKDGRENYNMRVTSKEVIDACEAFRRELSGFMRQRYGNKFRHAGLQVGVDLLLQMWDATDSRTKAEIMNNFKTRVVGYPNSSRINPGCWAKEV